MDAITEAIAGMVLVAATAVWERRDFLEMRGGRAGAAVMQFHRAGMEAPWLPLWMIHGRNEPRATRDRS